MNRRLFGVLCAATIIVCITPSETVYTAAELAAVRPQLAVAPASPRPPALDFIPLPLPQHRIGAFGAAIATVVERVSGWASDVRGAVGSMLVPEQQGSTAAALPAAAQPPAQQPSAPQFPPAAADAPVLAAKSIPATAPATAPVSPEPGDGTILGTLASTLSGLTSVVGTLVRERSTGWFDQNDRIVSSLSRNTNKHLPLAGGTLTGDLAGTNGTFDSLRAGMFTADTFAADTVAIGSTTATSTIAGNLHVKGQIKIGENSAYLSDSGLTAGDNFTISTTDEDAALTLQTLGRVGVASSTPWGVLSVEKNGANASMPILAVSAEGTANPFLVVDYLGRVGIGTSTPADTFALNGAAYLANITAPGTTANRLYANAGSLYWAGNLIGGATTGNWSTDGTNVWRTGGKVGIGTASPSYALDVSGLARFTGLVDASHFIATSTTATSTIAGHLSVGGNLNFNGTFLQNGAAFVGSQWTTSGSAIYYNTGNVGIGTIPSYKLHVFADNGLGSTLGNTTQIARFRDTTSAGGNSDNFEIKQRRLANQSSWPFSALRLEANIDGDGNAMSWMEFRRPTGNLGDNSIAFGAGASTEWMTIYNGAVGLATTTPWGKLSVTNTGTAPSFLVEDNTSPDTTPFVIDASGNVGIGTANPGQKLQVDNLSGNVSIKINAANNSSSYIRHTEAAATDNGGMLKYDGGTNTLQIGSIDTNTEVPALYITRNSSSVGVGVTPSYPLQVKASSGYSAVLQANSGNNNDYAGLGFFVSATDSAAPQAGIRAIRNGGFALTDLAFQTGGDIEKMRITGNGNGNVGIGTTSPAAKLSITQSAQTAAGGLWLAASDNTDFRSQFMSTAGVLSFYGGDTAGTLNTATLNAAGEWTNASDRAYKDDIEDLSYGLDTLLALQPRAYTIKNTENRRIGFIAQEVELLIPEVVSGEDGAKGISYGNLVAVVVNAVQELAAELRELAETVAGFADRFTTRQLCLTDEVGETCYTRSQLDGLLDAAGSRTTRVVPDEPGPLPTSTPSVSETETEAPAPEEINELEQRDADAVLDPSDEPAEPATAATDAM